ncbi:MAG: hypothetical protein HRF49_01460 [bacterium]|jgi:hypothetical protein
MKVLKFLKIGLKEVWRYAKWLWKHYDEIAPVIEIIRRLAGEAEEAFDSGEDKRRFVARRAARALACSGTAKTTRNLLIERAAADAKDGAL